nr:replication protein A 70 kDa DNA-binding subunit C-like [Tanacetum cinerariifolium]
MSRSLSVSRNEPELMLNQLELGATGTIVVMICMTWDVNSSTGLYLSTDFIVSDKESYLMHYTARGNIAHNFLLLKEGSVYSVSRFLVQPNKEDFRVMRFADFMLECNGDTRVRKSSVKSEGFNPYPFQFVEIDDLEPTNKKYLIDRLYFSNTYSSLVIDDEKIPVLKRLKHDDSSGLELTKEVLPGDDTLPKPGTLKNLLMWARNRKYDSATFHCDVKIDKIRKKNSWNFPSCGGEKCKKGNIGRKGEGGNFDVTHVIAKYMLEIEISGDTAEVVVVLFDETTTSLLKCSASAMVASQAQEGSNFDMVAAKTDSKDPEVKSLNKNPLLSTPYKPIEEKKHKREKLEDSDVDESFVADSQPKGDAELKFPTIALVLYPINATIAMRPCGKVLLPRFIETPKPLRRLLDYTEPATSRFRDQIRVYNDMFCFTSFGARIDHSINVGRRLYTFRINGQNYHKN